MNSEINSRRIIKNKNIKMRYGYRVKVNFDIYYPRINNKSVYSNLNTQGPLMKVINISKTGMGIISKVPVSKGDFLSFLIRIKNYPSFWCVSEIKWISKENDIFLCGCEFFTLTMEQINIINNYVKNINA